MAADPERDDSVTPSQLRAKVVAERTAWIRRMLADLRVLPLDTYTRFESDPRNPAAAESHLRRALEALFDLGRHVLARGFGQPVVEYKEVARALTQVGVLDREKELVLRNQTGRPSPQTRWSLPWESPSAGRRCSWASSRPTVTIYTPAPYLGLPSCLARPRPSSVPR